MTCRYSQLCKHYHPEKAKCPFDCVALEQCIAFNLFRQHGNQRSKMLKHSHFRIFVKLL